MDTPGFTPARITALAVITLAALALGYLGVATRRHRRRPLRPRPAR